MHYELIMDSTSPAQIARIELAVEPWRKVRIWIALRSRNTIA